MSYLHIAYHFHDLASQAAAGDQPDAARDFIEHAYTAALMEGAKGAVRFKLRPPEALGRLAFEEHVEVRVASGSVSFEAPHGLLGRPCIAYERLALTGHLFSTVAALLGARGGQGIADIGDGTDSGDYPRICYSSGLAQSVLIPDPFFFISRNYADLRRFVAEHGRPWNERRDILFWRGTTTGRRSGTPGPDDDIYMDWSWLPRLRLCAAARRSLYADVIDIAVTRTDQVQEAYLREAIRVAGFVKPEVAKSDFADYKYLVDIDGYSNAWSLLEKMIMGSVIFKVASPTGFRQWFYDRLVPWQTHVPVAADMSDLDERIEWALSHPRECEEIAGQAARTAAGITFDAAMADAVRDSAAALVRLD